MPLAAESGNPKLLELKEGFCFATANNSWPAHHAALLGDGWAPSMLRLLDESYRATDVIGRALALLLRRPAAYRADTPAASLSLMRAFRYFEPSHSPSLAPGLPRTGSSPHTDWFLVTLVVHRDRRGGLQLFRRGEWRPVRGVAHGEPAQVLAIFGDYFSALSGGVFTSPLHRVVLPPAHEERHSFVFFRAPSHDATVPRADVAAAARRARRRAAAAWVGRGLCRAGRALRAHASACEPPPPHNTLVARAHLGELARVPFGELLASKWSAVADSGVKEVPKEPRDSA